MSTNTQAQPKPVSPRDPVQRVLRWLPLAIFIGVLVVLVKLASLPLANPDTYFHLRLGQEFLDGWSIRHPGSPSRFSTADWLPTQWLSQVGMAAAFRMGGLGAVAWLAGVGFVGYATALYAGARSFGPPTAAALATIAAIFGSSIGLSARPQVLSYILVTVVAFAWLRTLDDGRPRWWLLVIAWVWPLLHGMWPIGIAIGVAAVLGMALDRRTSGTRLLRLAAIPVGSVLVAGLTPVGLGIYQAVLVVNDRSQDFSEWAPNDFTRPQTLVVVAMLAATLAFRFVAQERLTWAEGALITTAAGAMLYSGRTLPVAAAMLALLLARAVTATTGRSPIDHVEMLVIITAPVAALAVLAVLHVGDDAVPRQPAFIARELSELPAGTGIASDTLWGGYLLFQEPDLDPLMHGYGDAFTDAEFDRMVTISRTNPGWDEELAQTDVEYALLTPDSALAWGLSGLGWTTVAHAEDAVLLRAPAGWPAQVPDRSDLPTTTVDP